ncbi:hypothetical protein GCM10011316_17670 [Roseibium aquae]|uniref:Ubiquinone biosynthesis methyltransferase UbiE n=1 Tax=Roseibium aquae TaxID=1323746 RepID=A0A916THP5_9HYPH|nr:hypothetical protein [Roseibium aquae]GGB46002.1 hypothetical protein GCM10011316_17670 [Roseibium aquae]
MIASQTTSPVSNCMLELDVDIEDFSRVWDNCDLMSTYVSKMVSSNRRDSLLFANLYSSALNELLETIFRVHGDNGPLVCRFFREGSHDRIEVDMPSSDTVTRFYETAVAEAQTANARDAYFRCLFETEGLDPSLGILELTLNYDARLSLQTDPTNQRIRILADLEIEDETS